MKKITLAFVAMASFDVLADNKKTCNGIEYFSRMVMEHRQMGTPMREVMELIDSKDEFINSVIMSAYEAPKYSTEKHKKEEVNNFADAYYLACLKGINQQGQ
jgi:hypothetical protein